MSDEVYGFVAEPHGGRYIVTPATMENGVIRCHDISGFCGSWDMKAGGVFFPEEGGGALCDIAKAKACKYAKENNFGS